MTDEDLAEWVRADHRAFAAMDALPDEQAEVTAEADGDESAPGPAKKP